MDTSGARFVPIVNLTHDDDDTHSHLSDIPLQLPASAHFPWNNSAVVTFSQVGSDSVQHVSCLQPIPSQTGGHPWQLQYPRIYRQGSFAVVGSQETVRMVTQRAREALYDQRETARRVLLCQQGELLAATHQNEAHSYLV